MTRTHPLAILLALVVALGAPAGAVAHGGDANFRSVVTSVTPGGTGVQARVLNYDAELELTAPRGRAVTIFGYEGEPYARILADGTVQVNQRSAATYLNEDRYGSVRVPRSVDPEAPPRWRTVEGKGRFVFHDHRMHYMAEGTPPQVSDEGARTKVFDYSVPIAVDGERGEVAGTLYWVGPEDASVLPVILASVAVLLGGAGLVLVVRRRRRREDGRAEDGVGADGTGAGGR